MKENVSGCFFLNTVYNKHIPATIISVFSRWQIALLLQSIIETLARSTCIYNGIRRRRHRVIWRCTNSNSIIIYQYFLEFCCGSMPFHLMAINLDDYWQIAENF